MTTPVTQAGAATQPFFVEEPGVPPLTAEGVLNYCSSRLSTLDDLIQKRFAEQEARNRGVRATGKLLASLSEASEGQKGGDELRKNPAGMALQKDRAERLRALYDETTDPAARQEIWCAYKLVSGRTMEVGMDGKSIPPPRGQEIDPGGIATLDRQQYAAKLEPIKQVQDGMTKDSELSMIRLQSIISQRQLAVQLTTQMMSAMNDAQKGVIANIRG